MECDCIRRHQPTICVQGSRKEGHFNAISYPIYQTSSFGHGDNFTPEDYAYSRVSNPTREELNEVIQELEFGAKAYSLSSGMAAITCVMELFRSGDRVLATDDLYGGTYRLFENITRKNGIDVTYIDRKSVV